jgi:hypothetical protein
MSDMITWIAAEAERPKDEAEGAAPPPFAKNAKDGPPSVPAQELIAHSFPGRVPAHRTERSEGSGAPCPPFTKNAKDGLSTGSGLTSYEIEDRSREEDRERRIYRSRTVAMLRRYMRYSIETGRLPSMLGGEFFRAKVTTYTVVTFEDRVIFVHDMEKCLERLDEFSRQMIARHILQEHDQAATGRLLNCTERTVRTYIPVVLDLLSQILVEVGLLERVDSNRQKSCQGGKTDQISASDWEDGKYKF